MKKGLRVLIISDVFFPKYSGVVTAVLNLSEGLARMGCQVMLVVPRVKNEFRWRRVNPKLVTVRSVPLPIGSKLRLASPISLNLWRQASRFQPEVVHAHTPGAIALQGKLISRRLGVPFVGTEHTYILGKDWMRMIGIGPRFDRVASKAAVDFLEWFHRGDTVTTVGSEALREGLGEVTSIAGAVVVSNVMDVTKCRRVSRREVERLRQKLGLTDRVLIYVGRLSPEKRVDFLVSALPEIIKREKRVSLLLVGGGPEEKKLAELAEKLGVGERVVITGMVEYGKLLRRGYFQLGDIFVSASPYENQPMSVLEAMWFGLPLLVVNRAGLAELVTGNGEIFEPEQINELAEKAAILLANENKLTGYGKRSKKIIKDKYDSRRVTAEYVRLYQREIEAVKQNQLQSTPVTKRRGWQVSVVMPAYNEEKYIGECLASLARQTVEPMEIIVVDNNSMDRTAEIARQAGVRVVKEKKQGMIPARNRGFDEARGEIIARCDADCRVPEDWVERIRQQFRQNQIDGLTGPVEFYDLPVKTTEAARQYLKLMKLLQRGEVMVGPNMALTGEVWRQVRDRVELDDRLVHEDQDLSAKIKQVDGRIKYDMALVVESSARRITGNPVSFFGEYPIKTLRTLVHNIGEKGKRGRI